MLTVPVEITSLARTFPDVQVICEPDGIDAAVDVAFPAGVLLQARIDTLDTSRRCYVAVLRVDGHRVDRQVLHGASVLEAMLVRAAELAGIDPRRRQHPPQPVTDSAAFRKEKTP
jgi:hypothetical protein